MLHPSSFPDEPVPLQHEPAFCESLRPPILGPDDARYVQQALFFSSWAVSRASCTRSGLFGRHEHFLPVQDRRVGAAGVVGGVNLPRPQIDAHRPPERQVRVVLELRTETGLRVRREKCAHIPLQHAVVRSAVYGTAPVCVAANPR